MVQQEQPRKTNREARVEDLQRATELIGSIKGLQAELSILVRRTLILNGLSLEELQQASREPVARADPRRDMIYIADLGSGYYFE